MKKTENTNTVAQTMNAHIQILTDSKCKALDEYTIISDDELNCDNKEKSIDETYLHVFRHNTNSSLNVAQCFYKHSKKQVYILVNKEQFIEYAEKSEFTFSDTKDDNTYQIAHTSRIRFVVKYDDFVKALEKILTYDTTRTVKSSTDKKQKAQTSDKKQKATKQSKAKSKAQ